MSLSLIHIYALLQQLHQMGISVHEMKQLFADQLRRFCACLLYTSHANEVLAALEEGKRQGRGAVALHGKMIDAPIAARAKRTLADAEQILKLSLIHI